MSDLDKLIVLQAITYSLIQFRGLKLQDGPNPDQIV